MAIRTQRVTKAYQCTNPAANDSCQWEETWDDAVPAGLRTHTLKRVLRRCSTHAGITDDQTLYDTVMEEDLRREFTRQMVVDLSSNPDLTVHDFEATYDAQRRVVLDVSSLLTAQQQSDLQAQADIQFGPDKVVIV